MVRVEKVIVISKPATKEALERWTTAKETSAKDLAQAISELYNL